MSITPLNGVPKEDEIQFRPWDQASTIANKVANLERQLEWALMRRFNFDCFIKPYSSYTSTFTVYLSVRASDPTKFSSTIYLRSAGSSQSRTLSTGWSSLPAVTTRFFVTYANGTAPSGWASTTYQTRIQFLPQYVTGEQGGSNIDFLSGPGMRSDVVRDYEHALPLFMKSREYLNLTGLRSCAYNSMVLAAKQVERIPVMQTGVAYFSAYLDNWSTFNAIFFVTLDPDLGGRQHVLTLAFYADGGPTRFRVTVGAYTLTASLLESPAVTLDVYEYEVDLSVVVQFLEPDYSENGRFFY